MTAIWQNDGDAWKLLTPVSFSAEAALHDLVAQSPEMLPLSGNPRVAVVGREVPLGSGYADILAIEDNGRPVVIEVKLGRNSEARRAVVAQVMAYAAHLVGMTPNTLDETLSRSSQGLSLRTAVESVVDGLASWEEIEANLSAYLSQGWFRLVLVLDEAPADLVRLVGYLEKITNEQIIVDLITVASYAVNGTHVVVPQRVEPRIEEPQLPNLSTRSQSSPSPRVRGAAAFEEAFDEAGGEQRALLSSITEWARQLEAQGYTELHTTIGNGRRILRMQLPGESTTIATIWQEKRASLSVYQSVAARRAPVAAAKLRELMPEAYRYLEDVSEELLATVAEAYAEAAGTGFATRLEGEG